MSDKLWLGYTAVQWPTTCSWLSSATMKKNSGRMKINQSSVLLVKGADSIGNSVVALHGRRLYNFGDLKILVHDQGIYMYRYCMVRATYVIYISFPSFGLHGCTIAPPRACPPFPLLLFGGIMIVSTTIHEFLFLDSFSGECIFLTIITWCRIWYNVHVHVAPQQEIASQYHGIYMIYIWAGFLSCTW